MPQPTDEELDAMYPDCAGMDFIQRRRATRRAIALKANWSMSTKTDHNGWPIPDPQPAA